MESKYIHFSTIVAECIIFNCVYLSLKYIFIQNLIEFHSLSSLHYFKESKNRELSRMTLIHFMSLGSHHLFITYNILESRLS